MNFFKTFTIFAVQYINTVVMFVLAYNSFIFSRTTIEKSNKEHYIVGPFDEFNHRWFLVIGCPIGLIIIF